MKRKIAFILFCIVIVLGGVYMLMPIVSGLGFRNDELNSCSVSTGGGMLGGFSQFYLKQNEDGETVMEVRYRETHADRERISIYKASPEDFGPIREMVNKYGLVAASKRPRSRIQVLDGDTTTVSFDYSKDYFSVSDYQVLSSKMRNGFYEVIEYLHSLAKGECENFLEPQTAMLHLKSGYTLQYVVEDAFDSRLDAVLSEEREVSRMGDFGIVLAPGDDIDLSGAEAIGGVSAAGSMVLDTESGNILLLYKDHEFGSPVYLLAKLDGYVESACPLIEEMEGPYSLYLNQ